MCLQAHTCLVLFLVAFSFFSLLDLFCRFQRVCCWCVVVVVNIMTTMMLMMMAVVADGTAGGADVFVDGVDSVGGK